MHDLAALNKIKWEDRDSRMVWRGSDSNRLRIPFVKLAQQASNEALFDIGFHLVIRETYTEEKFGKKLPTIGFSDFFNYNFQARFAIL